MTLRDRVQEIRRVRAGDLRANPRNFRRHTDAQRAALAANLNEIGYAVPVIGYETPDGVVLIDGHLRVETVAPDQEIPVVIVDVDDDEAAQLLLTIDPLAAMAETDRDAMVELMGGVESDGLATAGFFEDLIRRERLQMGAALTDPDALPEPPAEPITKPGDLWLLGNHRLLCGDATKADDVERLMAGEQARLTMTSPPYWVGKEQEREHTWEEVQAFITSAAERIARASSHRIVINTGAPPAAHLTGDHAHVRLLLDDWQREFADFGFLMRYVRIWAKRGGLMHTAPRSDCIDQHWEFIAVFYRPETYEGQRRVGEKWATDGVWDDVQGEMNAHGHGAAYPSEIPERNIRLYTDESHRIYDPFVGSGTTIIAAERLGRRCHAMEIEPRYVDVAVKRWTDYTGREAVLA